MLDGHDFRPGYGDSELRWLGFDRQPGMRAHRAISISGRARLFPGVERVPVMILRDKDYPVELRYIPEELGRAAQYPRGVSPPKIVN